MKDLYKILPAAALLGMASIGHAATFSVNNINDLGDKNPGDGICAAQTSASKKCTLRAAIEEANALTGPDTVVLKKKDYKISSAIAVDSVITITGKGTNETSINGQKVTRLFDLGGNLPNSRLTISDMTLKNGKGPQAITRWRYRS